MKTSPKGSPRNQVAHVLFAWLIAVLPAVANDLPPGSYLSSGESNPSQASNQTIPGLQPLSEYPTASAPVQQQNAYNGSAQYQQQNSNGQYQQANSYGQTQNAAYQNPTYAGGSPNGTYLQGNTQQSGYANGSGSSYPNSQPYYGQAQQTYTPTTSYQQPNTPFNGGTYQGARPLASESSAAHAQTYYGASVDTGHPVLGKVASTVLPVAGTVVAVGLVSKIMTGSINPLRSMGYRNPMMGGYGNSMMGGYGGYNPMGMMGNPLTRMMPGMGYGGMGNLMHF